MDCISSNPRYIRRVDSRPSSDIDRCIKVGVRSIPARLTDKLGLGLAVRFLAMPAPLARSGGVSWIDFDQQHPGKARLIPQKLSELMERPTVQVTPLTALNLYAAPDTRQLLDSYPEPVAFGSLNYRLADNMVRIAGKVPLTPRKFFELALSRAATALLQAGAQAKVLTAHPLNRFAAVGRAETVRRKFDYPHIYPEVAVHVFGRRFRYFARRQEVELAARINEVAFALLKLEPSELTRPGAELHLLASLKRPNRDAKATEFPLEDAAVIGDCPVGPKRPFGSSVQLIRVGYLTLYPNRHLSRQIKPLSDLVIDEFVEAELSPSLRIPSDLRDVVTRLVRSFKRLEQHRTLFRRRQELHLGNQLHPFSLA